MDGEVGSTNTLTSAVQDTTTTSTAPDMMVSLSVSVYQVGFNLLIGVSLGGAVGKMLHGRLLLVKSFQLCK